MHGALPTAHDRTKAKDAKAKSTLRFARTTPRIPSFVFYILTVLVLFATYARHSSVGKEGPNINLKRSLETSNYTSLNLDWTKTFLTDKNDPFKCHAVVEYGSWLDPPETGRSKTPFQKWQPQGCMLRPYNAKAISSCLGHGTGTNAVFIGDSTVREVFWATAGKLDSKAAQEQIDTIITKHADVRFQSGETTLDFVWDPFLNSSKLMHTLDASRSNAENPSRIELPESKALVVVGGGLWYARLDDGIEQFKTAMDKVADPAHQHHHADILDNPGANRVFIMPVQPPYYRLLDAEHTASLKPSTIDSMNNYMRELTFQYEVDVLLSFLDMEASAPAYQSNGLHVTKTVAERQAEIILNARCNNEYQGYPYIGTCCFDYPSRTPQVAFIFFGLIGLLVLGFLEGQGRYFRTSIDSDVEPLKKHLPRLRPCLVIWAGLLYCYLADRTHLFDKVTKQYNDLDFFTFVFFIALAGFFTVKRSVTAQRPNLDKPTPQDQPLLSRDQTDEWKGWMQVLILAYHYTGGSKVLWIYRIIRLLVASYLFMSGYGHAAYFYQKKDFSLKRVVAVNIRLNLLSCVLPWMMDSDYLFYYFAPLVTYWYIIVYLTMRLKSSWNPNLPLFLSKIAIACSITTFLHTQPWIIAPFFTVINAIFGSKWDAKEWLFRCQLDQFIVYIGMILSVLYIRSSNPPAPPPPPQDPMANTSHTRLSQSSSNPRLSTQTLYGLDAAALIVYGYMSATGTTKTSSNALHPYISPLPILAFIHLRNATPKLRNHYSAAYAWVGKISLETFILQYHIWLAADTRGLLSLGIFGGGGMANGGWVTDWFGVGPGMGAARWADCIVLGVLFVWVSKKVADATGGVTALAMKMLFP